MRPHIEVMKRILLIAALGLATPAYAQDSVEGPSVPEEPSLMERGAQMLLEGLMQEMDPVLDDLKTLADDFGPAFESFSAQMGPALRGLMAEVEDWSVYHPPEMLDNGDIILRRKVPDAPEEPRDPPEAVEDPETQIDL